MPQMPTYHLKRAGRRGHAGQYRGGAVERENRDRPYRRAAPPCLADGRPLRGPAEHAALGDYVLAHAYLREDRVLDDDLPVWVPIPALAEMQIALEQAVAGCHAGEGFELKRIMRTGTVATVDNRNWELRDHSGPVQRLSQSRAIALDMESATIAANGFRFRVPYGTLLCVSDKPLHGELKLPGMASDFYKHAGVAASADRYSCHGTLRDMPLERLHSRKLRSFEETAFL
jgi:AMP nucleosidase